LVHGRDAANQAAETARRTFEEGVIAEDLPTINIPASDFAKGLGCVGGFHHRALVPSKSEARRQIKAKALKIK
jgi:tyrosyl-tRNA synthetase